MCAQTLDLLLSPYEVGLRLLYVIKLYTSNKSTDATAGIYCFHRLLYFCAHNGIRVLAKCNFLSSRATLLNLNLMPVCDPKKPDKELGSGFWYFKISMS